MQSRLRRLGKCDGCRQHKVKCDEQKPICGNCQRGKRPCIYPHGPSFTVVLQDPSHMTKYGKSIITPAACAMVQESGYPSSASVLSPMVATEPSPTLQLTGETVAEDGRGIFQILAPVKVNKVKKVAHTHQKKNDRDHTRHLSRSTSLIPRLPSSPEGTLTLMFTEILHTQPGEHQPLLTLGDWLSSIPSRIGSSEVVNLAAEFFVCSFAMTQEDSYSKRSQALQVKGKALRELQSCIMLSQRYPSYDLLLATKLHYAAEILLGVRSMHYGIHTLGLAEILKPGVCIGADEEYLWSIIDSTYIDDVTIAMTHGRLTVYDNDFYLSSTHPAGLPYAQLTTRQQSMRSMMHICIQCPRLIVLIRRAISLRHETITLASAFSLAERLWRLVQEGQLLDIISQSIRASDAAVDEAISDIIPSVLQFDSAQSMVYCTRFWLLQTLLCGMIDTLYRHFPAEYSLSYLPQPELLHMVDMDAASKLVSALLGLRDASTPLILVRMQGPLSASIGSWHRIVRYFSSRPMSQVLDEDQSVRIGQAEKMKSWLLSRCNSIQARLGISSVDEKAWLEALDCMAGEEMPSWIPTNVSFGSVDGEMVMKLEFKSRNESFANKPSEHGNASRTLSLRDPARFSLQNLRDWMKGDTVVSI